MSDKSRFLNFPIVMLAETIADPKRGLNAIACFAFAEYAKHCERDFESAFAQMAYLARSQNAVLPKAVRAFLARRDVAELAEEIDEEAWGAGDYPAGAADMARDCLPEGAITDRERKAVVSFVAVNDAARFFGRRIRDFDALALSAARSRQAVSEHEARHGKSVFASVPADYFFETLDGNPTKDDLRVFRCVAAVRSLNGKKNFVGVTKAMIAARMCGGKSPAVAASLAQGTPELKAELDALQSRKRIDRVLTLGAVRGFYGKVGLWRRVYVSTQAKTPDVLAGLVRRRFNLLERYRAQEQAARQKGQQGGTDRGTDRDSFNKSLSTSPF